MNRRACRKEGFRENFIGQENRVELCACWQDGLKGMDGGIPTCFTYERSGWSELGV